MTQLKKKYGFWTATAMVVGIVIGSGVFFKADDVLIASGGSLPVALLAWLIGGAIMIVTAYVFSKIATKIERVNGIVDYFEEAYGEKAGFNIAWFMSIFYYPTIAAVLAWVSAHYTSLLFNLESAKWIIAIVYLILFFTINILSPIIAGKFQVSATVLKLIPLLAVGVAGIIAGLINGQTISSFKESAVSVSTGGGLALATLSTAFAYEGWIVATTINAEIKNAKKNLPKALVFGSVLIVIVYMLYYIGISSVIPNNQVISYGDNTSIVVISSLFGKVAGPLLSVFVIVSCLGTLNGLIMGTVRGFYSFAVRGMGPKPEFFKKINVKTNSMLNSAVVGFALCIIWLIVWYGNFAGWFGGSMDISELPIAFLYVIYTSLYVWIMRCFKELNFFDRFVAPFLAIIGSIYIIWGAIQKDMFIMFTIILIAVQLLGIFLMGRKK